MATALAHLAIRHAHLDLADNPQFAECYRILGHSYEFLQGLERQVNMLGGGSEWAQRRYLQAVNAYRQAVIVDPEDVDTWQRLRNLFLRHGKLDLVLEAQQHVDANLPDLSRLSAAEQRQVAQERRQIRELISQVRGMVNAVHAKIERSLDESESSEAALRMAYQENCILRALELMESVDDELRFRDPAIRMFEATLRLEAGHTQQASEILAELEETMGPSQMLQWRGLAALTSVARGDFVHAVGLWNEEARKLEELRFEMVFGTLPLAVPPPDYFRTDLPFAGWPVDHTLALQGAHFTLPAQRSIALFNSALTYLEIGQAEEANERFEQLLAGDPDTTLRPLVRLYYLHASGSDEPIDLYSRSDRIPLSAEVFASEQSDSPEAIEAPRPAPPAQPDAEPGNPQ
jgi:tetratricopeptide (TPR) repeat protein